MRQSDWMRLAVAVLVVGAVRIQGQESAEADQGSVQAPERSVLPGTAALDRERLAEFGFLASAILAPERELIAIGDHKGSGGFAPLLDPMGDLLPLAAVLPATGAEPVRFQVGGQGGIGVRAKDTRGSARAIGGSIAYDASYGTSFWSATAEGLEEWLRVDHPKDGRVTTYEIHGGTVAPHGDAWVVEDDDGIAMLEVRAPAAWTLSGDPVDVWLDGEGHELELWIDVPDGVQGPVMVDPVWTPADDLGMGRILHTATKLLDGRVLITGGIDETFAEIADVDIYDPSTRSWSSAAPLPVKMRSHDARLLPDGRVMAIRNADAFVYDPGTDTWQTADPARALVGGAAVPFRSVELPNGQILFSGLGYYGSTVTWIYDTPTDQFIPVASMNVARLAHTLTVLEDGSVLAAGGGTTNSTAWISNTAELFVPDYATPDPYLNGSWVALPNMNSGHMDHGAVRLTTGPDVGKVLICAGLDGSSVPGSIFINERCDLYDPATATFSEAPAAPAGRQRSGTNNGGEFMVSPDEGAGAGLVVFAGGYPSSWHNDVYDPEAGTWSEECWLLAPRLRHTTTVLDGGDVLVTGGQWSPFAPYQAPIRNVETLTYAFDDVDCDGIPDPYDTCDDNPVAQSWNGYPPTCGTVSGRVYFDENDSCGDDGEPGAEGIMVRADNGVETRYALTNEIGEYSMDLPADLWDISVVARDYLEGVPGCDAFTQVETVNSMAQGPTAEFALKPQCEGTLSIFGSDPGTGSNVECNGLPYASPCPSNEWLYTVNVNNQGLPWTPGSPPTELTVTLPTGMDYTGPSNAPCAVAETATYDPATDSWTVTFELDLVGTGEVCQFPLLVAVDSSAAPPPSGWVASAVLDAQCGGQPLTMSTAQVDLDECSCDPNDKQAWPMGCDNQGTLETAEPLDYTVRFQNLGLGKARRVVITDEIDSDFDLESFRMLYTTHAPSQVEILEDRTLIATFDGIDLPASKFDPEGSVGAIHYRLDPAVESPGTEFTNVADIFFDQQLPVTTNETEHVLGFCPPGLSVYGPSHSGANNGSNPGVGQGLSNNPSGGAAINPNNAP